MASTHAIQKNQRRRQLQMREQTEKVGFLVFEIGLF
jgi:hypothetical protein